MVLCFVLGLIILTSLSSFFSKLSSMSVIFLMISLLLIFYSHEMSGLITYSYFDDMSMMMIILTLFISSVVLSCCGEDKKKMTNFVVFLVLVLFMFFLSDSLIVFFIMFELSLIPLMLIILSWGNQPERLVATQFMVLYTVIASSPLLFTLLYLSGESTYFSTLSLKSESEWFFFISLIAFFVKIPLFFFHSWLPKAHVEAPLEGSMILAGILLKIGMFGLVRMIMNIQFSDNLLYVVFFFSILGSLISLVFALSSDDMKMSVAFSSVSHMNVIISSFVTFKMIGFNSVIIVMMTHGVISPLLFFLVTLIYQKVNSRSILVGKGSFSKFPFFSFFFMIVWIMNLATPPFFSFTGELMAVSAIICFLPMALIWVVVYITTSSFFSIVNYGMQTHSSFKSSGNWCEKNYLLPLFVSVVGLLLVLSFLFSPLA